MNVPRMRQAVSEYVESARRKMRTARKMAAAGKFATAHEARRMAAHALAEARAIYRRIPKTRTRANNK